MNPLESFVQRIGQTGCAICPSSQPLLLREQTMPSINPLQLAPFSAEHGRGAHKENTGTHYFVITRL